MHKIKVTDYHYPEGDSLLTARNFYHVHLGNGCCKYFTSKRNAQAFLGELNDFLNGKMHDLNFLLAEIYTLYRRSWPYISGGKKARLDVKDTCMNEFRGIERKLDRMPRTARHPEGTHRIFTDLSVATAHLTAVLELLRELHQDRSNFVEITEIDGYRRRLSDLQEHLDNFGYEEDEENRTPGMGHPSPKPYKNRQRSKK